jgi:hypothetical protein
MPNKASEPKNTIRELTVRELQAVSGGDGPWGQEIGAALSEDESGPDFISVDDVAKVKSR